MNKGPIITLIIGIALFIIGIFVFIFLKDYDKNRGSAWLIIAIAVAIMAAAVIWFVLSMNKKKAAVVAAKVDKTA